MPFWIFLAIGAYLLLAVNGVADKFLLSKAIKHPVAYAFYVGITGPLTMLLWLLGLVGSWLRLYFFQAEFSLQFLSAPNTLIALLGGMCFPFALYFSYKAIQQTSVSRILPIQGGLVPVCTLILAYLILGERLSPQQTFAFVFLVLGAILISFRKDHNQWHALAFGNVALSSLLFALSLTITKYVFLHVNFASGLVWTRLGFFLASASFLIPAKTRGYIFSAPKEASKSGWIVYFSARAAGSISGFLQNYAIKIGSVTLVNSLQGTQYAFLLALTSILSLKFPKILKERINAQTIAQKMAAIILISLGLVFLVR